MNLRCQDLIKETQSGVVMLTKAALAIPNDKREWTPGGLARSTVDIMRECASFPQWITYTIQEKKMPDENESKARREAFVKSAPTLEKIIEALGKDTNTLCDFIASFPESRLGEEMTFPWGTYTIPGIMGFHNWNNTYHLGQINYLQLILGDGEMHM